MNAITVFPAIGKLVPLLGSDKDGEILAAAAAIDRTLKRSGFDWFDLVKAVEIGSATMSTPARRAEPIVEAITELDMARFAFERVYDLSHSEADFIRNTLRSLAYDQSLSPKQKRWLLAIYTALGGRQ